MANSEPVTMAVLSTKVEALTLTMEQLNNRFDIFQNNFIRNDVYAIRHEELAKQEAEDKVLIKDLARVVENLKVKSDKFEGAIVILRGAVIFLTLVASILGALWWAKT